MHLSGKLHERFTTFAHEQPSAPALISDNSVLTYAELDAAADTLARELHTRGIGAQEAIGVLAERSAGLPAAFLAILKAGGVYVPMVADLPADRLANMAQQAGIRRLIALDGLEPPAGLMDALTGNGAADASEAVIRPEALPTDRHECMPLPDQTGAMTDLAVILFTSGSTGTPKGVMIQHDACVHMALGHIAAHGIHPQDRILLSTSPGFILGFRELCLPFMSGAAFVPVSRSIIDDPDRLLALMERHRVSFAMFTPSYLRLLNGAVPRGLRCIVTAGERPNADDARHYAQHVDYWNVHGATEVCGTICMHHVNPDDAGTIPSGRPFANTAVYLLDESGNEVPKGEVGELHIVSVGVSRGYLNQPQLTAESFVETRYGRAFRTRDLARWNANGELETLGRADDVVKVSGQAVSLSEIERTLLRHPAVRRAAAMQLKGLLVACVECPDPEQAHGVDWREFLGRSLPSYMIPAQVAVLDRMPISSAGKVDRRTLLEIADSIFEEARALERGTAPHGDLERAIAAIWADLLGMSPILREHNFFTVGGTSLMAIAVSQRLQALGHNVTVQMVLTSLTVEALAAQIAAMQEPSGGNDDAAAENLATADQEGFWVAAEIGLAPAASHIVRVLAVRGRSPQPEAWQAAWTRLIDHHPALRTAFYPDTNGALRWRTVDAHELPLHAQLSLDRCTSPEAARDLVAQWTNERFRLTEPPLVRAGLIQVDEGNETLFWFVFHHSVVDGVSASLIQDDLLALLGNRPLAPAPHGIALASSAEQRYLASDHAAHDRQFWLSRLDALVGRGGEAFHEYVTERHRPTLPSGRGAPPLTEHLDARTVETLGRLAKAQGAGLHALLLAILGAEIRRRSGRGDVMVGSGISIRPAGGESVIGHFVNLLPVILEHEESAPFSALLHLAQSSLTETVEHAAYPAALINHEFRQRHPELLPQGRTSLFDIALTAVPPRTCVDRATGLTLELRPLPGELEHPAAGLDLLFSHEPCPEDDGLNLLLTWNPDVSSRESAEAWLSAFAAWARWLAAEPRRIEQPPPALLPHEAALLEQWEQGPERPRPNRCSHELFEELADRHPHKPAVVGRGHVETFARLDARANGIAHNLIRQGVGRGTTVAVLTAGSADLPATVLGIWKAGGAYLPLPYELPPARLAAMVVDAAATFLAVLDRLPVPEPLAEVMKAIIRPEECLPSGQRSPTDGSPEDVAYIIYTSGTTGTPKGIPVTHVSFVNAVFGVAELVGLRPDDRMSLVATVGFDASLWELGHGLLNGIALVPVSQELRDDPWEMKKYYKELGVTIAFHAPSYLRVSEQVPFEGLRILLTGGEAPNHRDVRHHADRLEFWNFYGPTEATIVVSGWRIPADHDPAAPLPVGCPLPNVRISLRREDGSPVPPGVRGEIWLGGIGIACGYLNRPDLSAERFVTLPEGRFYRSGDYGRWNRDGQIEISGRIDDQVKLNGQRVELGEIEQTLRAHPAIADAVVLVEELESGAKVLRAFVRAGDSVPSETALAAFLFEQLPAHMVPASTTFVPAIPLTPAGKVDRGALLAGAKQQIDTLAKEAPRNPLEAHVAAIWAGLLGTPVAHSDNFFALGGNSLLAVTMAHRVSEALGQQVSARTLFAGPTLAEFVAGLGYGTDKEELTGVAPETDLVTVGEREFWTAEAAGLDTRSFTIPMQYRVIGNVEPDRWQAAWSTMVGRHEGLRTFFQEDEHGRLRRQVAPTAEDALEFAVTTDRSAALAYIRQRQAEPLPMAVAPLWRAGLVEARADGAWFFWLALHHAVGDGQSVGILLDELTVLLADGALPPSGDNAGVFAVREQSYLAATDATNDANYWIKLLRQVPASAFDEWPLDRARSSNAPSGNHRCEALLDPQTTAALKTIARSHEASLHALMLTLLALESRRRTGRSDILVGTPASVRESQSDAQVVGYAVNMLPLHLGVATEHCFGDLLRATQRTLGEALLHARQPFAHIYRAFLSERPELRHPQRYPLFDIAVTENPDAGNGTVQQRFAHATTMTESVRYERTNVSPGLDLILTHGVMGDGGILLQLQLNAAIYAEETAVAWLSSFAAWARWLTGEPDRCRQPLPALLPHEAALTAFFSEQIPPHMLPADITPVPVIPLPSAGKVDRGALKQQCETLAKDMPQDPFEARIAAIWADVLGVPVARSDNFFGLGGNSLLAITVAHRVSEVLGQRVSARSLFAAPTLAAFFGAIGIRQAAEEPVGDVSSPDLATVGEEEFWIAEAAELDTRTFTIPVHYLVIGDVAPDRWHGAWSTLVARHAGLRTFFQEDENGQLRRRVAPAVEVVLESAVTADRSAALTHIRQRQGEPVSMAFAPLWRAGLVEARADGECFFWLALHHSVGDGQSIGTLFSELTLLLADHDLPTPAGNANVFAIREQAYLASMDATNDADYWSDLLKQVPGAAFDEWPLDIPRSSRTPSGNHRLVVALDQQTTAGLKALARGHESSLHSLMLALIAMETRRRTGRSQVVIGTTASVRELASDTGIVAYGVNMLPLHLTPAADHCFGDLLHATQASLAKALQHARQPFARIYRSFWNEHPELRHPQRYPLFDIAVTENPGTGQESDPQRFTRATLATASVSYERTDASPGQDMVLIHETMGDGTLILQLQLNAAIYTEETARNWFQALTAWARWLAEDPARAGQPLPRLLPAEEEQLARWEQGDTIVRPLVRFHELFEQMVDRPGQAERPAVITPTGIVSYGALDEEANTIAHTLAQAGAGRGSIVAVLTGRSARLPAALLGIWKAGATYLPLAADLPPERLFFMVRDAEVSHLIALDGVAVPEALSEKLPDVVRPEQISETFRREHGGRPIVAGKPGDVAYIIYTSGSTGEPKGTLIGHDSYVNLVLGAAGIYGLTPDDRCLMFASPSFDVSLSDMGVPLASGAAICVASHDIVESPNRFLHFLQELRITVADITPTYLRLFEGGELSPSLRILVTGGEPPVLTDVKAHGERLNYFNAYGPTESTITSSMGLLRGTEQGILSAGRPLANTSVHIFDVDGHPLPPGVVGEIWLGGVGLSQGYLNRPELTQVCFADTPSGRRYRTGDLGRWSADGTIQIIGRMDDQVKLNGIRIELGEIEHALAGHPAISQAVALLRGQNGGAKSLWAVVRPTPGEQMPGETEWHAYLTERLPSHMIPSGVVPVTTIPVAASGKVDRPALLALLADHAAPTGLTPPLDDLERSVAEVWSNVLGRSPIHREDNFFALGGHSLLAIAVAHRLEKTLGRAVPARELFAEPTLAGFSERLRTVRAPEPTINAASDLATEGEREFWTAERAGLDTSGFTITLTLAVQGDAPPVEQWRTAWDELVVRHDALRTGFREDESGILRREVVDHLDATLELQVAASNPEAQAYITGRQSEPFSLETPGLWRAGLVRVTESGQAIFWFVMHHAVGDGLSLGILVDELTALLRGVALAPLASSFKQSAAREAAYLGSETAHVDAAYWQRAIGELMERAPNALDEWPLDKPRPNVRTAAASKGSHCLRSRIDAATADGLRTLAQRNGASLHALMLALLGLEVRRRTERSRFLLGTAASTRQSAAEARTVGYFVNMLPLPCCAGETDSIDTAIRAMQQGLAAALQHARYPFARMYGDFRREHPQATHPGRYPLFDIAVTENPAIDVSSESGLCFTGSAVPEPGTVICELRRNAPTQDLVLVHEGQPDGSLALTWFVNAAIYTVDTAHAWFDSLVGWMRFLAETLPKSGEPLPLLLPMEEQRLETWQKGADRPLTAGSFPDLFRRLAERHPNRPALITDAGIQSYETVNTRADALAHALLEQDLKRGEAVAVFTERSAALPETVLGIWKAGGCYLPLTADLPAERLAFMAKDAGCRTLIVLDGLEVPPELEANHYTLIRPEQLTPKTHETLKTPLTHEDLAYIIYTSGSTGVPKGVVLHHGGMLNLGLGGAEILDLGPDDRALMMASPSFDLWISDLVTTWSAGAAVVPVRREEMNDITGMLALIQRHGVTAATMSPSYLRLFERADFPGLRALMTVGEPPIPDDARFHAANLLYVNGYGPTENTAGTAYSRVTADAEQITAGRPLSNTYVYIVDERGKPVPPGVTGEVWVGGVGLAVGYLNRPDLTAASFVTINEERRYCTGDLGRWLRSGELQILGRSDSQVKLRGQRVELGEIEHRLAAWPGVQQAVAIVETQADQTHTLRAFVTFDPHETAPSPVVWSSYLAESLPSYMIPSAIHQVVAIPLTAAGKVDRRALLGMLDGDADCTAPEPPERHAPQNTIEKRISQIWAKQLGLPLVTREDDFFALGGDSLKAIATISRLRREFECRVNDLYEHPKLAGFAQVCRPRPDHLRDVIGSICNDWKHGSGVHVASEAERDEALRIPRAGYAARIRSETGRDLAVRQSYRHVLLTGATGYLGSYLLRELLSDNDRHVTVVVRSADDGSARTRLGQVLVHYFGNAPGAALRDNQRLTVLAGDLRHGDFGLSRPASGRLTATVDAIYHCAANVNHFGHYRDFQEDNVVATRNLLSLASRQKPVPADFHFISTLSVAGKPSLDEFRLFTEYDLVPNGWDENYYIRSKQEGERLVLAARGELANASIHRVGNVVFATDSVRLQQNMANNAFFRQLSAFVHLGVVPLELHASLCHVDIAARAIIALSNTKTLTNEIHHIEKARLDLMADFIKTAEGMTERVRACDFGGFLERLHAAIDEPDMERAVAETVETFGIQTGRSPLERLYRLEIASDRTQALLDRLGVTWPAVPAAGQNAMLRAALKAFH